MKDEAKAKVMKPDIFDRVMGWKVFRPLNPFYKKYKQPLLYLFFGGLCTVVNIVSFWLGENIFPPLVANIFAWIISVAFAFFTNRTWVFASKESHLGLEATKFVGGRIGTLVLEEMILWIGIEILGVNTMIVKVLGQIAVIIGNYVISKWVVFT